MRKSAWRYAVLTAFVISILGVGATALQAKDDPLPSWNEGSAKQSIIDFVTRVTEEDGPDFVEPKDRIATFRQ